MASTKELALVGLLGAMGGMILTMLAVNLLWNNWAIANVVSPAYGGMMQCCGVSQGDYCVMAGQSLWRMPNYSSVDCSKISLKEFKEKGKQAMGQFAGGPEAVSELQASVGEAHIEQLQVLMGMMHYGCRGMQSMQGMQAGTDPARMMSQAMANE